MVLEQLYMISQVVAAFAVVASLVFVGLQMRQSDLTQQALMHQARTDRHMQIGMTLLDPSHMEMYQKSLEGDGHNLSDREIEYLIGILRISMLNTEDILWQTKRGYLSQSVLDDQKRVIGLMLSSPAQRTVWQLIRQRFGADLIAFVDKIERETPLMDKPLDRRQLYLQVLKEIEREAGKKSDAGEHVGVAPDQS